MEPTRKFEHFINTTHEYQHYTRPEQRTERENECTEFFLSVQQYQKQIIDDSKVTEVVKGLKERVKLLQSDEDEGGITNFFRNLFTRISNIFHGFVLNSTLGVETLNHLKSASIDATAKMFSSIGGKKDDKDNEVAAAQKKINFLSNDQIQEHARNIQKKWLTQPQYQDLKKGLLTFIMVLFNNDQEKEKKELFLDTLFSNKRSAKFYKEQLQNSFLLNARLGLKTKLAYSDEIQKHFERAERASHIEG